MKYVYLIAGVIGALPATLNAQGSPADAAAYRTAIVALSDAIREEGRKNGPITVDLDMAWEGVESPGQSALAGTNVSRVDLASVQSCHKADHPVFKDRVECSVPATMGPILVVRPAQGDGEKLNIVIDVKVPYQETGVLWDYRALVRLKQAVGGWEVVSINYASH